MANQNKEPVLHNEQLEKAIDIFRTEQTKENMNKIMTLLESSTIMQPAVFPHQGGLPTKKINLQPRPAILKNQSGESFFPIFTSKNHIPEEQKYPAMLYVRFSECAKLAAKPELNLKGIVINPFTHNLVLHRPAYAESAKIQETLKKIEELTPKQKDAVVCSRISGSVIPKLFFDKKEAFLEEVAQNKEKRIVEIFQEQYEKDPVTKGHFPYDEQDFEVMNLYISDSLRLLRIGLPQSCVIGGSYSSIFLFLNPQSQETLCFSVKKGGQGKPNTFGKITEQGNYEELGEAPAEGEELYRLMEMVPWA